MIPLVLHFFNVSDKKVLILKTTMSHLFLFDVSHTLTYELQKTFRLVHSNSLSMTIREYYTINITTHFPSLSFFIFGVKDRRVWSFVYSVNIYLYVFL